MKKRLNLYCMLIAVLILVQAGLSIHSMILGFSVGWNTVKTEHQAHPRKGYSSIVSLNIAPDQMNSLTEAKFSDQVSHAGRDAKVWPLKVMAATPGPTNSLVSSLIVILSSIAEAVFAVMLIVHFMKFILNVNRQRVFEHDNIRHLRWVGGLLLFFGILETMEAMIDTFQASQFIHFSHYQILYSQTIETSTIVCGLVTLLLAEAFAIGLKMKEDAELTI